MNREQMIAWLTLEGWEPSVYRDAEGNDRNYAVRKRGHPTYCLDVREPIHTYSDYSRCGIDVGGGSWFTPEDHPGTWTVFSDRQLSEVVAKIGADECK